MEADKITIRHNQDHIGIQYPFDLESLKNICKARFNIGHESDQIITFTYNQNKIKLVEIKTQQDLEQSFDFIKKNHIIMEMKTYNPINQFQKKTQNTFAAKCPEFIKPVTRVITSQEMNFSKPKTEKIIINCKEILDNPSSEVINLKKKIKNFQQHEEIDSFKDFKEPVFIYNNPSINLEKLEKKHRIFDAFTLASNPDAVNILKCKEENNEKLKIFKVILKKVKCHCGDILKDRFLLCACCKMWYRCINCGAQNGETHRIVNYEIDVRKKLEKLKKNIMRLGFVDERQIEKAIKESQFYYSGAVGSLFGIF